MQKLIKNTISQQTLYDYQYIKIIEIEIFEKKNIYTT